MEHTAAQATWDELDVTVAYALLRLRVDVFVVEQACPYPELDGRDLEPSTQHRWLHAPGEPAAVLAYLRVLDETGAGDAGNPSATRRVGRVVTAPSARGHGLSRELVDGVVADHGHDTDVVLDAQSHLAGWYARLGFVRDGDEFVEDGIPHTPMRRRAG